MPLMMWLHCVLTGQQIQPLPPFTQHLPSALWPQRPQTTGNTEPFGSHVLAQLTPIGAQIGFVALLVTASVVFGLTIFGGWGSGGDSGYREASSATSKPGMPMQGAADWSSGKAAGSLARSAQLAELQARPRQLESDLKFQC